MSKNLALFKGDYMKIVSWNSCMRFRDKCVDIQEFDADIYVIPECEDPSRSQSKKYKEFATNYIWVGKDKNKGLGIFAKDNIKMERIAEVDVDVLRYFIPVRINDTFNLLAVWAMDPYVVMIHDYYNANKDLFNQNLVMCGDFNSSVVFDKTKPKNKTFSVLLHYLKRAGLVPAYHYLTKEKHGKESEATFFETKRLNYRFHLDHVFAAPYIIKSLEIIDNVKWIKLSDHLPLVFEIDETKFDK